MPLRMLVFVVLYLAAVVVGRATRLEGTGLALVWPAAGVAFIWLADAWRDPRPRRLAFVLLLLATVAGNWATGASPALALAFGLANLAQTWVSCAVFIRLRPAGWALQRGEDVRALLASALAGACASAAIGPVAVLALTDVHWPATPAAWALRNATGTIVVAAVGLRVWDVARHRFDVERLERGREFAGLTLVAGGAYMLAFGVTTGVPLAFLVVPLSVWVAFRYHTTLAALHGLFTGTTMIALTLAARGPFALQAPQVRVMLAQAFIGMVSMLTLWLALRRDERVELERELEHARDEALEASTLKSAFLANMSHEIRTPMNGVLGMTELLLDTGLDHRQRDYATQVRGSAESLLKIIDDILDVSKIEAGKLTFEHAPFSLRDALEDVRALLAPQAEAKGIALTLHVADGVPALLGGDPVRVRQIVTNLLGNAVKFTDRGGIDVRVGGDREQVTIVIVDTGVGIAPDVLPDLFDAFAQADATTTRRFGGTGLGLAIARQLAELMGGGIHAVSTPGSGSTFTVTLRLPAVEGEAPPRRETKQPPPSAAGSLPVLVVEDNPVNQIVASEMLRKRGVPVQLAVNGREAVDMVRAHRFAAVFMDCQMPELDGYEATRELRRLGETLPIIAMTANAMKGDREKCLDAGMDDYLAKPLRADELDASLARWLGAAVVDPSFLAELGSLAGGIIDVFVSDADQRVADFVAALAEGDVEAARKPVHSLAGSAASVGAVHLAEVARRAQYADDPGALLDELGEALAVTRAAFTR